MKKIISALFIGMFLIVALGAFIESSTLPGDFQTFVENIAEQRGINESDITNVSQVDFSDLPGEVNLENIDETSLGIYQVSVVNGSPIYVITMTGDVYSSTQASVSEIDLKRSYLNFGYEGKIHNAGFLQTSTGVETSVEKGYVMMRSGNITGISTNLDVTKSAADAQVEIIIYKNGEVLGFGNTLVADATGVKTDYDIQSEGIGSFEAGDVISTYLNVIGNVDVSDITTLIEITTRN